MNAIAPALAGLTIGNVSTFRNLAVYPIIAADERTADYFTLDQALGLGGIHVTELSDGGSVPDLKVVNTLDRPVLLLDGEEVLGAKQNRVFNLTILVPAETELLVPVSCVEAGRWHHESSEFAPSPRAQYAAGRSERLLQVSASLSRSGARRSDQSQVWQNIAAKRNRMGVDSATGAMADIYERFSGNVDEYVQALVPVEGQVGALFVVNTEIVGMDLFDVGTTLAALLPKLVRSYALDAIEAPLAGTTPDANAAASFLDLVRVAPTRSFAAVGLGEDIRLQSDTVSGAALVADSRVVHLCAFRSAGAGSAAG